MQTVLFQRPNRLGSTRRILRHTTNLTILAGPTGASGWIFELPASRYTLLLSPGPFRGFSGEGTLLTRLATGLAQTAGSTLGAHLAWQSRINPHQLAQHTQLTAVDVDCGLAWLAAHGRLGYDTTEEAWYHRELPTDNGAILRRNPRLNEAERLARTGHVQPRPDGFNVTGDQDITYSVIRHNDTWHCTCPWRTDAAAGRGPCKHVLAAVIATQDRLPSG